MMMDFDQVRGCMIGGAAGDALGYTASPMVLKRISSGLV
jgi:ADP-ribosylglycohydrolase